MVAASIGYKSDQIIFLGKKQRDEIRRLMNRSDMFALISFRETFGIVYAEALSQNLPVVYSTGEGFDGWISDSKAAVSALPTDINSIQLAIETLGKKKYSNNEISRTANNIFNWKIVASTLTTRYKEHTLTVG